MLLLLSLSYLPVASGETLGAWNSTTDWKNSDLTGITAQSCVTYSGYIYCVGGFLGGGAGPQDEVEYASLSSSGVGTWYSSTTYPTGFDDGSCAAFNGYIYCVGGDIDTNGDFTTNVYYATVSSSGVGTWTLATNPYPLAIAAESCAASGGNIYCVGGTADESYPNTPTDAVYTAAVSSSGVGSWSLSYYPDEILHPSCVISSGYLYCVGGGALPEESLVPVPSEIVAYASISDGVGSWTVSTDYPTDVDYTSCAASGGYVYCVGGEVDNSGDFTDAVYYGQLSSSGISGWTGTTNYPQEIYLESCVPSDGYLYCVGGQTSGSFIVGAVNYSGIGGASSSSSSSSSSSTSSTSTTTVSTSQSSVPVCPSTSGGVLMPVGATFTDQSGNTWTAPGGSVGGDTLSSYFFPGPMSNVPPPMWQGWGGIYGTYNGQQGWIITFYCA
jgi:hypothetical protein